MAKTETDILRYLNGDMAKEEIEAMDAWIAKKSKHKKRVELVRRINVESSEMPNYRQVNIESEWTQFLQTRKSAVSELDLLYLTDGTADYATKSKIERWKNSAEENLREYKITEAIGLALLGLKDYRSPDITDEWSNQIANRTLHATVPTSPQKAYRETDLRPSPPEVETSSRQVLPMWTKYAAAAMVALLITAGAWFFRPQSPTLTFATTNQAESIELSDGTKVNLQPNSELTYFRDVTKVKQRNVSLIGSATFDVARDDERPFELTTKDEIGISVLGTAFSIMDDAEYARKIRNEKGRVKAYSVSDPSIHQILEEGDEVSFDGKEFAMILPEPIKNEVSQEILYVLDHIMRTSRWKVITKPNTEFSAGAKVMIDLDQPYEDIMKDLSDKKLLEYRELTCSGCYEISRFIGE